MKPVTKCILIVLAGLTGVSAAMAGIPVPQPTPTPPPKTHPPGVISTSPKGVWKEGGPVTVSGGWSLDENITYPSSIEFFPTGSTEPTKIIGVDSHKRWHFLHHEKFLGKIILRPDKD